MPALGKGQKYYHLFSLMRIIGDFHIHSKYSRATSPQSTLENYAKAARAKGINLIGTGDFTHPEWFSNLKKKLEPAETGLYKLRQDKSQLRFILTSEISCVYSKKGKVRKIHILVLSPSLEMVKKINDNLSKKGNLAADGRPILGIEAKELLEIVLDSCPECLVIPAHCLTPWFGIFGSKSGFDSVEECFEDYSKYIFAIETGLSADPPMIWRIPDGRRLTLVSNSDAHSPSKVGREVNVFETELSYPAIAKAIKTKNPREFLFTIEFYPQEGKYYYDGHRNCGVSFSPQQSKKYNNICPVCGKPLTIGVLNRVEQLADKPVGFRPKDAIPFKYLVPLREIISQILGQGVKTKGVENIYRALISKFGNEFNILLNVSLDDLESFNPQIAQDIGRLREGKVYLTPGYDGVFGKVSFSQKKKLDKIKIKQGTLFNL